MSKVFVVSDIHGMYAQFEKVLQHWNRTDRLVILGDMIDRGAYSLEVVQKVMALQIQYGADHVIVLKGNHEDMFGYFLNNDMDPEVFLKHGGREFLQSFIGEFDETDLDAVRAALVEHRRDEVEFMRNARLYYSVGRLLFTHAGFNSELVDWQETKADHFLWTRKHYEKPNLTGLVNIFGHTPVRDIHMDKSDDIWINETGDYIGIDGGCAYGGQLNGVLLNEAGEVLETYVVKV